MNRLAKEMLMVAHDLTAATRKEFQLRDYLKPGGRREYRLLPGDLEQALANGFDIVLYDVPGYTMISASADMIDDPRPWYSHGQWYKSAKDAIDDKGGRR